MAVFPCSLVHLAIVNREPLGERRGIMQVGIQNGVSNWFGAVGSGD